MSWAYRDFEDVVNDVTGGNIKTLTSEYLTFGKYPVVDQGKEFLAGYMDDGSRLCKANLPVVLFGDHTKVLKYIDFDFCLGADGTKILKPIDGLDEKFLFHFLNSQVLPDAGYSRHFKYLKKLKIPIPPLEEQKRIAAILDKADELRRLRQESIKKLNTLSQSIFYEMFGDHIALANNWERTKILDCCEVNPKRDFDLQDCDKVSFLPMAAVSEEGFIFEEKIRDYYDVKKGFTHFRKNDVLVAKITPCFENGKGTIAQIKTSEVGFGTTEFHVIRPSPNVTSRYIFDILHSNKFRKFAIPKMSGSAGQKRVPAEVIKNYEIYLPPLDLLSKYEIVSRKIEVQKNKIKTELVELDSLFQSLQHRAFNGEL